MATSERNPVATAPGSDKYARVFNMSFAGVYPHSVAKAEKKGRTKEEVDEVIRWLTGYTKAGLAKQIEKRISFRDFFDKARRLNPNAPLIKASSAASASKTSKTRSCKRSAGSTNSSTSSQKAKSWKRS